MRLAAAAAAICLLLIPLAFSKKLQKSQNCAVQLEKAECRNLLKIRLHFEDDGMNHKYRILIYKNHFQKLNKTEKICVLKKIMEFYTLVNEKAWTTKVSEQNISSLHQDLRYFEANCLKCRDCRTIFLNMKQLKECRKYNKRMNSNGTAIVKCQLRLLKNAKKKNPAEIQEKSIYELDSLKTFLQEKS